MRNATMGSLHYMAEEDDPRRPSSGHSGPPNGTSSAASAPPQSRERTQLQNALLFSEKMKETLRRCEPQKAWWHYRGGKWRMDTAKETEKAYNEVVPGAWLSLAATCLDDEERKNLTKWALQSQSRKMQRDTLELAHSYLAIEPEAFDRKPWALNCPNGTLCLQTGKLLPHQPSDYLTQMVPVPYDPEAECPKWKAFLSQIFDGDDVLIRFVQKAVGYSLTGETSEQVFFLLHGHGANGKSTFIEVLRALLGEYSQQADFSTFQDMKMESRGAASPEVARFKGIRLVAAVEAGQGRPLSEVRIKQFTGGDKIVARFLHQNVMEFSPEFKIWLVANHRPKVRESGTAFWRRVMLIPFQVTIPKEARNPRLKMELLEELPGLLAWVVEGCLLWQQEGLHPPARVLMATEEYKDEEDILREFLEECCHKIPGAAERAGDLYCAYRAWCERSGEYAVNQKAFGTRLTDQGHPVKRSGGRKLRTGLRLKGEALGTRAATGYPDSRQDLEDEGERDFRGRSSKSGPWDE